MAKRCRMMGGRRLPQQYSVRQLHTRPQGSARRWRNLRVEPLETRLVMDAAPLISEFLASNSGGLEDVDGDSSDWIELYNPNAEPLDLQGWALTDDASDLNRWVFPSVTLGAEDFLIVFASDKNRAVAGEELHTNFRLSASGDYLALVRPDGTVASAFTPGYPTQASNVSYGTVFDTQELVVPGANAQYLVPTSEALGRSWTAASFDASTWNDGRTGLGFGVTQSGFSVTYIQANTYVDNLDVARNVLADTSLRRATVDAMAPVINYLGTGGSANFADDLAFPTQEIGEDYDDFVLQATAKIDIPAAGLWSFGVNSDDGFELTLERDGVVFHSEYYYPRGPGDTITVFDIPTAGAWNATLMMYERGGGAEVELFAAPGDHPTFTDGDFALVGDRAHGGLTAYSPVADVVPAANYRARFAADSLNGSLPSNAVVTQWSDSDPNGDGILRAAASGDPRLIKNALNEHSVIRFDTSSGADLDQFRLLGTSSDPSALNPLAGAADFSVAVVFRTTTAGVGGETQWWENSGLVDAEQSGVLDDWGLAINSTGQIGAGLGNPDVTTYSSGRDLADGQGHIALLVRSGGAISLYVDGRLQSLRSDGGVAHRSISDLVFGSLQTNLNGFTGDVAEVRLYDIALSNSQVARVVTDLADIYGVTDAVTSFVGTDLSNDMLGINSSIYVRVPFTMADATAFESLTLTMRYDDGFVAYLNGVEVARRNAPDTLTFDASATVDRDDLAAQAAETMNLSDALGWLQNGPNVLAVQGLNSSPADGSFLLLPELMASSVRLGELRYFAEPTPGAPNSAPSAGIVERVEASAAGGFFTDPIFVSLTSSTPGAEIRYTLDGSTPTAAHGSVYSEPIVVSGTMSLRAAAFLADYIALPSITRTYVFTDDVIDQSSDGTAPLGWPISWGSNVVDYGMDPDVVYGVETPQGVVDALLAIPSLAITTDLENLFDPSTGIYANAYYDGRDWERPAALELLNPDGSIGFQVNAGLRIRGGYSRSGDNPKHAFRLFFRGEYGDSSLDFPMFGDEGVQSFKKLDLRTAQNYSWSFGGDPSNTFIEDVFSRETQRDMGQPYTRSRWYHLYLNGQYWGLYQTQERAEAEYAASYFGGTAADYDVIKPESGPYIITATDGNLDAYRRLWEAAQVGFADNEAYMHVQGKDPDGSENLAYEALLDTDNLITYMINILYGGNLDAPISAFLGNERVNNFFAVRDRTARQGFRYFLHDSEHMLRNLNENRNGPYPAGSQFEYFNPQWLHQQLMANAEYCLQFADAVQQAFFNGGPLTVEQAQARWQNHMDQLDGAMIAESARWGDAKRPDSPLGRADWLAASTNTRDNYLSNRGSIVLQQFRDNGLLSALGAPQYLIDGVPQQGGQIAAGSTLRFAATGGLVYYTTDGSDPRLLGGGINPAAEVYDPSAVSETLVSTGATWKYFDGGGTPGSNWLSGTFDDAAWSSGAAELGYGDGDEATVVSYGPDVNNKYVTTYFRHSFAVGAVDGLVGLTLQLRRDDGAVVYVNGVEAARSNMPSGDITFSTLSASAVGGNGESTFFQLALDPSLLQVGDNLIAVEIHQCSGSSSDISFDAALVASRQNNPALTVNASTRFIARVLSDTGTWSARNEAQYVTAIPAAAGNLAVSEIMYHPPAASGSEPVLNKEEFEFIELRNIGNEAINLAGVRFTDGIGFDFSDDGVSWLDPGQCVVVVRNQAAFEARYGTGIFIAGSYQTSSSDNLSNGGERITLVDAAGQIIQSFVYDDDPNTTPPWPTSPDGGGYSLTIRRPNLNYNLPASWRASYLLKGTPGYEENDYPANLQLAGQSVVEKVPHIKVGDLSAEDPNTGDIVTFSLRPGADGALFTIVGHELRVGPIGLDYEQAAQRSVIVRATDLAGLFVEKTFVIQVIDTTAPIVTVDFLETTDAAPVLHGGVNEGAAVVSVTVAGTMYAAINNGNGTWALPPDTISPSLQAGVYDVVVTATDPAGNVGTDSTTNELTIWAAVVDRHIFYNHSVWDGNSAAANAADDGAIAAEKMALMPGQKATFANYTSYDEGINGLMVDVYNLVGTPTAGDFLFRVGNNDRPYGADLNNPADDWPWAPAPIAITVRAGAGLDGADRVTLIWAEGAIRNCWLQLTVLATDATGLAENDVFYVGNAVGESGNSPADALVNATDEIGARNNPHGPFTPALKNDAYDYNRDKLVNATDQILARNNRTNPFTALKLITPPLQDSGGGEGEGEGGGDVGADWLDTPPTVSDTSNGDTLVGRAREVPSLSSFLSGAWVPRALPERPWAKTFPSAALTVMERGVPTSDWDGVGDTSALAQPVAPADPVAPERIDWAPDPRGAHAHRTLDEALHELLAEWEQY